MPRSSEKKFERGDVVMMVGQVVKLTVVDTYEDRVQVEWFDIQLQHQEADLHEDTLVNAVEP